MTADEEESNIVSILQLAIRKSKKSEAPNKKARFTLCETRSIDLHNET
jgi:hypothetical protein